MRLRVSGSWPGPIVIRRSWAWAEARPWNDDVADAQVRLIRGGAPFLAACTDFILDLAPAVLSPPLLSGQARPWRSVGYEPYLRLSLYRRDLSGDVPQPGHPVTEGAHSDLSEVLTIDRASFDRVFRLDQAGLEEALTATPESALLLQRRQDGRLAGFAVVGHSGAVAYLQRMAVHPDHRRSGVGKTLVRRSLLWARRRGASSVLLNTQPGNAAAAALYRSEGFRPERTGLEVLRRVVRGSGVRGAEDAEQPSMLPLPGSEDRPAAE